MNDHQQMIMNKIHKKATKCGLKVLSKEFGNLRHPKIKFKCEKNHKFELAPRSFFDNGCQCPECRKNEKQPNRYKELKTEARKLGYRCISNISQYTGDQVTLTFQCIEGHRWEQTARSVFNGARCPICRKSEHIDDYNNRLMKVIGLAPFYRTAY